MQSSASTSTSVRLVRARSWRAGATWAAAVALMLTGVSLSATPAAAGPPAPEVKPTVQTTMPPVDLPAEEAVRWRTVSTAASDKSETISYPHTCGIRTNGTLWCWGDDGGFLGDGAKQRLEFAPRQVGSSTDWQLVVTGSRFSCAIDGARDLWCWGRNSMGQLGDGTHTDRDELAKVSGPTGWGDVEATYWHACGITEDGRMWCWGANSSGQLGDGTTSDRSVPTRVGATRDWVSVAIGSAKKYESSTHGHSCAVAAEGTLWCWGENDVGQLGTGASGGRKQPTRVGTDSDWVAVSADRHASCATKSDGSLWCWGQNKFGRLGDGTQTERSTPVEIAPGTDWASVDVGNEHTCGIQVDASAWCWGRNALGRLGDGTTAKRLMPTAVAGGYAWAEVSAAFATTCGVRLDGVGMCWGDGRRGQRGTGDLDGALAPDPDEPIRGDVGPWNDVRWTALSGGDYLRCGIVEDGRGACWSEYSIGFLPSGGSYAQPIHDSWTWNEISTGYRFMCGVRSDGALFCGGQPPPGGFSEKLEQIGTETSWTSVNGGYSHVCGIQNDASLWCWGSNRYGQLGTGDTGARVDPVQVDGSWASVATGDWNTCGIQTDGSLWCWGQNNYGQLGLGFSGGLVLDPQRVGDRTDWGQVSGNSTFTCGTTVGHKAYCWGYNHYGQLGDGTQITRTSPVAVVGPADWQYVIGENGINHNCGLRLDGSAWCWGQNDGMLGTGDTAHSMVPVPVAGGQEFSALTLHDLGGCGIDTTSRTWCWGKFDGDGTRTNHLVPARLLSVRGL